MLSFVEIERFHISLRDGLKNVECWSERGFSQENQSPSYRDKGLETFKSFRLQITTMRFALTLRTATKFFKHILHDPSVMQTPQDLAKNATPQQIAMYNVLKVLSFALPSTFDCYFTF